VGLACHDASAQTAASTSNSAVAIPGGEAGIGFDDLRYSAHLGRVLVPAGRTGNLCLVDPASGAVETITGFGKAEGFEGGHGDGTTSVDEGRSLLFAIDRTTKQVAVVDPAARKIVSTAPLAGSPDYVRFVAPTDEIWVTEPDSEAIEVFDASKVPGSAPRSVAKIAVSGGPESLVVDGTRGRAYSHLWESTTVAIDLKSRTIVARWPNGCGGSRGIALDEPKGFLFVACAEGRAAVLDVAHDGKELSHAATGSGVDIIDYDPATGHLYVPGAKSATLTILGVSDDGRLSVLGSSAVARGSHCVATDGHHRAFVGDPDRGRLIVIEDTFPSSRR
jgi:DNA-binding beta-propeller fold protein YncE